MKKPSDELEEDELRPHYDAALIKSGVRGKYADRFKEGTNLALLEPDVAEAFPNDQAVNEALRMLIKVADASVEKRRRRRPVARTR